MTARKTPDKADRSYLGNPLARVEFPTFAIPARCHDLCSWVSLGGGISRLKYASAACGERHQPVVSPEEDRDA